MKRQHVCAGVLAMVGTGLLAAATHAGLVVPNGDFQTGDFTGWTSPSSATMVADAGPTGAGDYAVRVQTGDWGSPFGGDLYALSAPEGTELVAKIDVKAFDVASSKQTQFGINKAWGGNYGTGVTVVQDAAPYADGAWHTVSWPFTVDASGSPFGFSVYAAGGGGNRDLYVDNFRVEQVPEPTALGLLAGAGLLALHRRRA